MQPTSWWMTEPDSDQPQDTPPELVELRGSIDAIDHEILRLLGRRRDVVTRVADVKKRHTLAVRDHTREADVLLDRRQRCERLGLQKQTVESLYRLLMTDSRDHQASLGTEMPADLPTRTVAVIGSSGGMGTLFCRLFSELGQEVIAADLDPRVTPGEAAASADAVMISVPIEATLDVIRELGPRCREDALLFDITSTKSEPVRAMCEHSRCNVIGTHPMFGPGVHTLQQQRIVLVPGRMHQGADWDVWLRSCLKARGMTIIESTGPNHDRSMAIVQVLTHFSTEVLGLAMARLGVSIEETLEFSSPVYLIELLMTARHFCQKGDLYGAIHMANPERGRVAEAFQSSLSSWRDAVETGDVGRFNELFSECSDFFGAFGERAMEQSAHLIDRVVDLG